MARDVANNQERVDLIDLTGGQPDLVPEWPLMLRRALNEHELHNFPIRSEDNLSNDFLWKYLTNKQIGEIASDTNYTRVACFKGFDEESFAYVVRSPVSDFTNQLRFAKKLLDHQIPTYFYATFAPPNSVDLEKRVKGFFESLCRLQSDLPLKVVPLRLRPTTTWKASTLTKHSHVLEQACLDAWFSAVEREFGNEAFRTELSS